MIPDSAIQTAFRAALEAARSFEGATAPNPPVGAAALDATGALLAVRAHERAGSPHAEALVLAELRDKGIAVGPKGRLHTMVVTLEPCNHQGQTPPCSEALISAGVRTVLFGAHDPNPKAQGGAASLRAAGVQAEPLRDPALRLESERLIEPFTYWIRTGLPWVTVKQALTHDGSMIPLPGHKTFTSPDSLRFAHELRRKSDVILTGVGTVLADRPEFTVRHVPDHINKQRLLIVADRQGLTPRDWIKTAESRGFDVVVTSDWAQALREAGRRGMHRVLVEAGPRLTETLLQTSLWNEHVVIIRNLDKTDRIETSRRVAAN